MSDRIEELRRKFQEQIESERQNEGSLKKPRPELDRGMLSAALNIIFTTLRYLAPATLITLFWGQQSFLFKILKSIDHTFRAVVYSSEEQKQEILKWVAESSSVKVEHLNTVWRHGWILCGILDAAIPGACAGHPSTRLDLKHAQVIAELYLGIEPVFSRQELETIESLSKHQEWKLTTYLDRIKQALSKLPPPVSQPTSQRTSPETNQFTLDYVAKGPGVTTALVRHKSYFKIYPTTQQSPDPGEITILIRGPKDTYGMVVLPPVLGKSQLLRHKLLGLESKTNYTENTLPITQGTGYMRHYGKNDMNKTYYIPKTKYDIEIETDNRNDHIKIGYTVCFEGKYEISITSRGQNIMGSPFLITSTTNILKTLEKESFCLEDGEEVDIIDVKNDRKVVLRIVDFVTEKMLLKENGILESISDEKAQLLMKTDNCIDNSSDSKISSESALSRFHLVAKKVVTMQRVCKNFNLRAVDVNKKSNLLTRHIKSEPDIPDIINSTLADAKQNSQNVPKKKDKIMMAENITLRLREDNMYNLSDNTENSPKNRDSTSNLLEYKHMYTCDTLRETSLETEIASIDRTTLTKNPSRDDELNNVYGTEKALGTFVASEFQTNKSLVEETQPMGIQIFVEQEKEPCLLSENNPFIEKESIVFERPKTPILKIITGAVKNRDDSVYIDPSTEYITEEILGNEFINPFYLHENVPLLEEKLSSPDFIIGAPVSLPPIMRTSSPECTLTSMIITPKQNLQPVMNSNGKNKENNSKSVLSTPLETVNQILKEKEIMPTSSSIYSIDSNTSENIEIIHINDGIKNNQSEELLLSQNQEPSKKDMWDSAYVSIDETNASPDTNNNENKQNSDCLNIKCEEFCKMGPAEREIWESCKEITNNLADLQSPQIVGSTWEAKRMFTPILEENDRSLSSDMKDKALTSITENDDIHPGDAAFAELDDTYHEYYLQPNNNSMNNITDNEHQKQLKLKDYKIEHLHVDSASDSVPEVKRRVSQIEGAISEVQSNAAESVSVSQVLHVFQNQNRQHIDRETEEIAIDKEYCENIVLEKKKYWDDRIKEIEHEENKVQDKRKRLSCSNLRHNDSLAKKRGEIVKNILEATEINSSMKNSQNSIEEILKHQSLPEPSKEHNYDHSDIKLVEKWKKYWDSKLVTEVEEIKTTSFRSKSPRNRTYSSSPNRESNLSDTNLNLNKTEEMQPIPVKQEFPEELFKAFETSPKRFFGTSRKQILNKIDSFLGKTSTVVTASQDDHGACTDSGLVSSRISLFHSISKTEEESRKLEEFTWKKRKSQSLHNIYQPQDMTSVSALRPIPQDKKVKKTGVENVSEKRRLFKMSNKSLDNNLFHSIDPQCENSIKNVKKTVDVIQNQYQPFTITKEVKSLQKLSISKSEMDIFNRFSNTKHNVDDLDKYKSCEELPKINVKNVISLYETVSKSSFVSASNKYNFKVKSNTPSSHTTPKSTSPESVNSDVVKGGRKLVSPFDSQCKDNILDVYNDRSLDTNRSDSVEIEVLSNTDSTNDKYHKKETSYLSLSDIDLEIVEIPIDENNESHDDDTAINEAIDYKSRFKRAKEYFKSLEELRNIKEINKRQNLNECELLLTQSTESPDGPMRPPRRVKNNIKSNSVPSNEIPDIWNQIQDNTSQKFVKISEKFNVDDLFNDITEGRLSRQSSLRGIPNKKAVLETFKSMENLSDRSLSSYDLTVSQLSVFAKENNIRNSQTYLSEYPYLPTTNPSKYHSRLDPKASGLVSMSDLLKSKPRRNSVPDIRLNPKFTVDL